MKKSVVIAILTLILLGATGIYQYSKFYDGKLHLIFCDVGQGDAIFIRTPNGKNILIDAGPGDKVLSCLSNHTPFWERKISLAILTHPHNDHFAGFIEILKRYEISVFGMEKLENKTQGYRKLIQDINNNKIKINYLFAGDSFKTEDGFRIRIMAPDEVFLMKTSPNNIIGESKEFSSLITLISYGDFQTILTGDSQVGELKEAIEKQGSTSSIDLLQVPHHGSKTGVDREVLQDIRPKIAVISVGKDNRYGHPTSYVLNLLKDLKIKILRTDEQGDIEVISDKNSWIVQ